MSTSFRYFIDSLNHEYSLKLEELFYQIFSPHAILLKRRIAVFQKMNQHNGSFIQRPRDFELTQNNQKRHIYFQNWMTKKFIAAGNENLRPSPEQLGWYSLKLFV